jgi:hypothetical protein
MDGRYKEGIKDVLEASQKTRTPFTIKVVKREQKRLLQLAILTVTAPILVLTLLFYIQEVTFNSQAAIISLALAGFSTLFFLLYLIPARWQFGKLPLESDHIWQYWYSYLKNRMRFFWLLHTGIICSMASLINVTYDIDQSSWSKWVSLSLVSLASVILINNFFKSPYKYALKEASSAL